MPPSISRSRDTAPHDCSSLGALEEDIHTVAREWFGRDAHESVDTVIELTSAVTEFRETIEASARKILIHGVVFR